MKKILKILEKVIGKLTQVLKFPSIKLDEETATDIISENYKPRDALFNKSDIVNKEIDLKLDLSIIVPVYNSEKYLSTCLDSIVNQKTKFNYEVVCINDGSKDNSINILEDYQKKYNFIKIISQENGGISSARNTGINNASGKYFGFIDNDDKISENYVESLMNRAYEKNADIVKCNFINFDGENRKLIRKRKT